MLAVTCISRAGTTTQNRDRSPHNGGRSRVKGQGLSHHWWNNCRDRVLKGWGSGSPSQSVRVSTNGDPPPSPPAERSLAPNRSTSHRSSCTKKHGDVGLYQEGGIGAAHTVRRASHNIGTSTGGSSRGGRVSRVASRGTTPYSGLHRSWDTCRLRPVRGTHSWTEWVSEMRATCTGITRFLQLPRPLRLQPPTQAHACTLLQVWGQCAAGCCMRVWSACVPQQHKAQKRVERCCGDRRASMRSSSASSTRSPKRVTISRS